MGNLAILLKNQGKLDEAEPLYRRELAGEEEALGPAHPSTLGTVRNLAILLDKKGDAAAARERAYSRAEALVSTQSTSTCGRCAARSKPRSACGRASE